MDTPATLDDVSQRLSRLETTVIRRFDVLESQLRLRPTTPPGAPASTPAAPPSVPVTPTPQTSERPAVPPKPTPSQPAPPVQPLPQKGPSSPAPPTVDQRVAHQGPPPHQRFASPQTGLRQHPTQRLPVTQTQTFRPPTEANRPTTPTSAPVSSFDFATTLESIMKWAGLALVASAAIFLVSTAITRGWIGPELQLAGAAAIGFSFYAIAAYLSTRRHHWTSTLNHGATIITIACAIAAHEWLQLVSFQAGLTLTVVAAVLSGLIAISLRTPTVIATSGLGLITAGFVMQIASRLSPVAAFAWLATTAIVSTLIAVLPTASTLPHNFSGSRVNYLVRWPLQRAIVTWSAAAAMLVVGLQITFLELPNIDAPDLAGITSCLVATSVVLWLAPALNRWLPFAPLPDIRPDVDRPRTTPTRNVPTGDTQPGDTQPGDTPPRSELARFVTALDHRLVIGLPFWAWLSFTVMFERLTSTDLGIMGAAIGLISIVAVTLSRRFLPKSLVSAHLFGAGTVLNVAAIVALDGPAFLAATATQAVALAYTGRHLRDLLLRVNAHGLVAVSAVVMLIQILSDFGQPLSVGTTLGYFCVGAAAFAVAYINTTSFPSWLTAQYYLFAWLLCLTATLTVAARLLDGYELIWFGSTASVASFFLGRFVGRPTLLFGSLLAAITVLASTVSTLIGWTDAHSAVTHAANLTTIIGLAAGTYWSRSNNQLELHSTLLTFTWFLSMTWLASVLTHVPQGQLLLSGSWALAASGAVLVGVVYRDRAFQALGMVTLTIVLLKLFTFDLRTIDTFWRAGLFFVLGVGFLRLGYELPKLGKTSR